jgi:hypothetical protein
LEADGKLDRSFGKDCFVEAHDVEGLILRLTSGGSSSDVSAGIAGAKASGSQKLEKATIHSSKDRLLMNFIVSRITGAPREIGSLLFNWQSLGLLRDLTPNYLSAVAEVRVLPRDEMSRIGKEIAPWTRLANAGKASGIVTDTLGLLLFRAAGNALALKNVACAEKIISEIEQVAPSLGAEILYKRSKLLVAQGKDAEAMKRLCIVAKQAETEFSGSSRGTIAKSFARIATLLMVNHAVTDEHVMADHLIPPFLKSSVPRKGRPMTVMPPMVMGNVIPGGKNLVIRNCLAEAEHHGMSLAWYHFAEWCSKSVNQSVISIQSATCLDKLDGCDANCAPIMDLLGPKAKGGVSDAEKAEMLKVTPFFFGAARSFCLRLSYFFFVLKKHNG